VEIEKLDKLMRKESQQMNYVVIFFGRNHVATDVVGPFFTFLDAAEYAKKNFSEKYTDYNVFRLRPELKSSEIENNCR